MCMAANWLVQFDCDVGTRICRPELITKLSAVVATKYHHFVHQFLCYIPLSLCFFCYNIMTTRKIWVQAI